MRNLARWMPGSQRHRRTGCETSPVGPGRRCLCLRRSGFFVRSWFATYDCGGVADFSLPLDELKIKHEFKFHECSHEERVKFFREVCSF